MEVSVRSRVRATSSLAALVAMLAVGACGRHEHTEPGRLPPGGSEPTTAQALAYLASLHTGVPDSARAESDAAEEFSSGGVGAELRYGSTGEHDGDSLTVAVGTGLDPDLADCGSSVNEFLDGCVATDAGVLLWEEETPEEDPGVVYVIVPKGDASVLLFYSGPAITGDPNHLDLPISVPTLFGLALDDRVDDTTSQAALDAGADLPYWAGPAPAGPEAPHVSEPAK
jgi:hypothetical protein